MANTKILGAIWPGSAGQRTLCGCLKDAIGAEALLLPISKGTENGKAEGCGLRLKRGGQPGVTQVLVFKETLRKAHTPYFSGR